MSCSAFCLLLLKEVGKISSISTEGVNSVCGKSHRRECESEHKAFVDTTGLFLQQGSSTAVVHLTVVLQQLPCSLLWNAKVAAMQE